MSNVAHRSTDKVVPLPTSDSPTTKQLRFQKEDGHYRELLGAEAWYRLPAAVQRRFAKKVNDGETQVYSGEVVETTMSWPGRLLAHVARIVGGPLPLTPNVAGSANVIVAENAALRAQTWTRIYAREGCFPQVITSAKRFDGPTGLEECLGCGLLMRLRLLEEDGALVFRSTGYAIEFFGRTFAWPAWLAPGQCDVIHRDIGGGRFTFTLELQHKLFGTLVRQVAIFSEE